MCSISHKIFEHIRKVLNANLKEFAILIAEIAKKGSKKHSGHYQRILSLVTYEIHATATSVNPKKPMKQTLRNKGRVLQKHKPQRQV